MSIDLVFWQVRHSRQAYFVCVLTWQTVFPNASTMKYWKPSIRPTDSSASVSSVMELPKVRLRTSITRCQRHTCSSPTSPSSVSSSMLCLWLSVYHRLFRYLEIRGSCQSAQHAYCRQHCSRQISVKHDETGHKQSVSQPKIQVSRGVPASGNSRPKPYRSAGSVVLPFMRQ